MTHGHVGYTSAILHFMNIYCQRYEDEESILYFLCSPNLLLQLTGQPLIIDPTGLGESCKLALHNIWELGTVFLEGSKYKDDLILLVRSGWIFFDDDRRSVSIFCPISKQLILIGLYKGIPRPDSDNFKNLAEFMDACLERIPAEFLQDTINLLLSGAINESKWQKEVFRIGSSLLTKKTEIGVEVSHGFSKVKDDKMDDKSDEESNDEITYCPVVNR